MIGTILNAATVVAGTLAGRALGGRLPQRIQETQMAAIGLITAVMGVQNALVVFADGHPPHEFLATLLGMLVGCWIGEALHIDDGIQSLGRWAERRFVGENASGTFARAFVTTSLIFCVGPLTVLGSIDDGLRGDITKLTVKSVLDGVTAAAFSAALGWGVLLSAVTILFVQGGLTLAAGLMRGLLDSASMSVMTAAGGVMLIGLGLNLLGVTKTRIASLLPSLVLAPLFLFLLRLFGV